MPTVLDGTQGRRRYERVTGPFPGRYLGPRKAHVLVYDLNIGGGFINFTDEQPLESTLMLKIKLPEQGPITVKAEAVHRHQAGMGVRFVELDGDTTARLARTVEMSVKRQSASQHH